MFESAKGKQQNYVPQLQCQEQCIDHIPYYLSGLSRAHFPPTTFLEIAVYIETLPVPKTGFQLPAEVTAT